MVRSLVSSWRAVLAGGLIAGSVDILAASLIGWLSPVLILHAIASGVLGRASFSGGAWSALLGLLLQWLMALLIAAIYTLALWRAPTLRRLWAMSGVLYGVVIYLMMNFVVVPLSAAPFKPQVGTVKNVENLLAMMVFGLIVAFCAKQPELSVVGSAAGRDAV